MVGAAVAAGPLSGGPARLERPPRVMIACSGLGHVARGFETFSQECFDALRDDPRVDLRLVQGAGSSGDRIQVARALRRESVAARGIGRAFRRDGYFAEQMTFAAGCVALMRRERPDIVYFSDWAFGRALAAWRARTGWRFRLLLSNGAGGPPPYHPSLDHVQQLTPVFQELAEQAGEPAGRHTLLPLGLSVPPWQPRPSARDADALRHELGLPEGPLVLSVAALNSWSKRLDYLIRELAEMEPRTHLVLLGERENETPALLGLAAELLGEGNFTVRKVAPAEVPAYYRAADAFVLCSLHEGQGRVLLEALAEGTPVVAHDAHWARFVTGGHARLADLTGEGTLRRELGAALAASASHDGGPGRRFVEESFSWQALAPRYVDMLERCAALPPRR